MLLLAVIGHVALNACLDIAITRAREWTRATEAALVTVPPDAFIIKADVFVTGEILVRFDLLRRGHCGGTLGEPPRE